MTTLVILNDPPYGTERCYNALRLAASIARNDGEAVRVFLLGDAAACARSGQKVPAGYYNIETLLSAVTSRGGRVGVCGTCMDARGIAEPDLAGGAHRSTMSELTDWTLEAGRTLIF